MIVVVQAMIDTNFKENLRRNKIRDSDYVVFYKRTDKKKG